MVFLKNKLVLILIVLVLIFCLAAADNFRKTTAIARPEEARVQGWFLDNIEKRNRMLDSQVDLNYRETIDCKRLLKKDIEKAWEEKLNNRSKSKELLKSYIKEIEARAGEGKISQVSAKSEIVRLKNAEENYWKGASESIDRDIKNIHNKMNTNQKEIKRLKEELDFLIDLKEERRAKLKAKEYMKSLERDNELLKDKAEAIRKGGKLPAFLNNLDKEEIKNGNL